MSRKISYSEVQQHKSAESCWVVLYGNVYDVTAFVPHHPGGSSIVLQLAGQDATEEFDPVHPKGTLEESLPGESKIGIIDKSTLPSVEKDSIQDSRSETNQSDRTISTTRRYQIPDTIEDCLSLDDIEDLATSRISKKAWGYYYSASDDLRSKRFNNSVYQQILLRPRVFIDCTRCSTATSILGYGVNLPIFVSPAAMARLAHPDGEAGIARACAKYGAAQIISNNASMSVEDVVADAEDQQVFGWQLYVKDDRKKSELQLAKLEKLPSVKFIVLTLDAPVPGKREDDERQKNVSANLGARSSVQSGSLSKTIARPDTAPERSEQASGGVGKALFAGTAADLTWSKTLTWLKQHSDLPIVLKGIQTHEDAYIAATHYPQIRGIILSNHGGRAADTAPPAIHTLLEIRKYCPEVLQKLEVFVDGGIKRGTDVVKALALGARAVGIGRSPLYGLGAGGQAGVERVMEILKAELETAMRLLGCETVGQLGQRHVNSRAVERDIFDGVNGLEDALARSRL